MSKNNVTIPTSDLGDNTWVITHQDKYSVILRNGYYGLTVQLNHATDEKLDALIAILTRGTE